MAAKKFLDTTNRLTPQALKIVTKRLFSAEGLLAGRSSSELASILGRLSEDAESEASCATAIDRTAFISLMGDIGALHADAKKASRSFSLSSEEKQAFVSEFSAALAAEDLSPLSDDILEKVAKLSAGTNVVGPSKKDERRRTREPLPRKGLYNLGDEIDEKLGVTDRLRIPQIIWRPMEIVTTRLWATHEPFVAHMSGAPGEILMVWDMLRGKRADDIYCAALRVADAGVDPGRPMALFSTEEQAERRARLAGACAMLVGIGHHSAVEVAEGALKYLGQDLRGVLDNPATQDAAHLLGAGAATDLFVELFDSQASTP
ncbi:hypothetical protein [Paraburkholderia sp. BR10882]|uniref:hypothetical protein n=1 Tax=unclassified Paraburkholderia TaxID=2615204 RepID=UPI0034D00A65